VLTQEIGDTWQHGSAASPWKHAAFMALQRARARCDGTAACDPADQAIRAFDLWLGKIPEHTSGEMIRCTALQSNALSSRTDILQPNTAHLHLHPLSCSLHCIAGLSTNFYFEDYTTWTNAAFDAAAASRAPSHGEYNVYV